jgi:molecular chaperone DnaJ
MKNYYEILGIEEKASPEEIKKQYRKLSKEFHPDVNPEGGDRFKEIAEAYENLSDPQKRASYDNRKNNPFGGGFDGNLGDIFSQMFGGENPFGGNPFQQRRQPSAPPKIIKLTVSPIESYLGANKKIQYTKEDQCMGCLGSGGEQKTCSGCGGTGATIKTFGTGFMVQQIRTTCESCGGKGYTLVNRCNKCLGRGTKTTSQELDVKLPIGIDSGQFLKLQGYGDFSNGVAGDLVIQVEIIPQDDFEKLNNDLIYTLFLDNFELMNDTYSIPHPLGELSVKSPKKFDTSVPLRLKGKGYNGGDMYIKLQVRFDKS